MSQTQKALQAMLQEGITMSEAAARYGITVQAVSKGKCRPPKKASMQDEITRLRQQLATLTEQRDRAVEALFIAAETFLEYANIHAAKTPPDFKKAEFNSFRAQQMIEALAAIQSTQVTPK